MASKKATKGKRYSAEEKQQITDFVNTTNEAKGRGGVTAAVKKFGVSALTISTWLKGGAVGSSNKAGEAVTKRSDSQRAKFLSQLAAVDREIAVKRKELDALEAKFQSLKQKL